LRDGLITDAEKIRSDVADILNTPKAIHRNPRYAQKTPSTT